MPPGHSMPPGAQWLLTADQATVAEWTQRISSPSVRAAAAAFSQISMQRIAQSEQQDQESVLVEPNFQSNVSSNKKRSSIDLSSQQTSAAAGWRRLRDVRAAHQRRQQLPAGQVDRAVQDPLRIQRRWRSGQQGHMQQDRVPAEHSDCSSQAMWQVFSMLLQRSATTWWAVTTQQLLLPMQQQLQRHQWQLARG